MIRLLVGVVILLAASPAAAQLRIVTYNTNTFDTEGDVPSLPSNFRTVRAEADIVFEAIGEEMVNGIQRPADIILLQEQQQPDTTTQNLVERLNAIYAGTGITYARGFEVGDTTSSSGFGTPNSSEIRQSVVYRTDTVQLVAEDSFGNISGANQPRETLLHQFRPLGYGPDADLYLFNSHFEAGDNLGFGQDLFARENEATDIRSYITANNLGSSNVIVGGDFNVDSNFETSGVSDFGGRSALEILAEGTDESGRVLDPLFPNGELVDFQIFSSGVPDTQFGVSLSQYLTQSPCEFGCGSLTSGGIDDRFDFLLQSDELLDGEGVASIPNSLRSFGNNGTTGNDAINDGNTIQIAGLTSFTTAQVLDALEAASDHLPVVEDFQLPAILSASLESLDAMPLVGEAAFAVLSIENAAPVATAIGADELDYEVSISSNGSFPPSESLLSFNATGSLLADGTMDSIVIPLDTTSLGTVSFTATVTTSSPGVPDTSQEFALSYEVVRPELLGDYNLDGVVDTADYTVWRDNLGAPAGTLPNDPTGLTIGAAQHAVWAFFFGAEGETPAFADAQTTPEPASHVLLLGVLTVLRVGRCRRR